MHSELPSLVNVAPKEVILYIKVLGSGGYSLVGCKQVSALIVLKYITVDLWIGDW